MRIKSLGAVGTVTGSCFKLEMDNGHQVLLDCGLFQGGRQTELRNTNTQPYDADKLTAVVITHAHMDHSGLVPRLVRDGFNGPIYATQSTCELLEVLWLDAAHIQEQEAIWKSRKNNRQGKGDVEPLYTEDDARMAMTLLKPMGLPLEPFTITPGLTMQYVSAGHILGASSIHFTAEENGKTHRVAFSGDIGRNDQLLLPDPDILPETDTLFMETTYGNRLHKDMGPSVDELLSVINQAVKENGKILIPAFAVERTQEIIYLLAQAWHDKLIPQDLPIILDSPLATAASQVYTRHTDLFDEESQAFLSKVGSSPQQILPSLRITSDARESQAINDIKGSALIIAGSGMANAGRIVHHLKHNLWRSNCHVIFVGFQAQGTTGRRLVEGAKTVKIFREPINVEAHIHTIGGFSGHADQRELLAWLGRLAHMGLTVNLIHGEATSTSQFAELAGKKFPEVTFKIPTWLEYASLAPSDELSQGDENKQEAIPTSPTLEDKIVPSLARRLERLLAQAQDASGLPPHQLAELENSLEQVENLLVRGNKRGA